MGRPAPSLHRESTDSLIMLALVSLECFHMYIYALKGMLSLSLHGESTDFLRHHNVMIDSQQEFQLVHILNRDPYNGSNT